MQSFVDVVCVHNVAALKSRQTRNNNKKKNREMLHRAEHTCQGRKGDFLNNAEVIRNLSSLRKQTHLSCTVDRHNSTFMPSRGNGNGNCATTRLPRVRVWSLWGMAELQRTASCGIRKVQLNAVRLPSAAQSSCGTSTITRSTTHA